MIDLSVVIVSYNTKKLILDCIESLAKNTKGISYEVIVVDNASTDGSDIAISKIDPFDKLRVDAERSRSIKYRKPKMNIKTIKNNKNLGFPFGSHEA